MVRVDRIEGVGGKPEEGIARRGSMEVLRDQRVSAWRGTEGLTGLESAHGGLELQCMLLKRYGKSESTRDREEMVTHPTALAVIDRARRCRGMPTPRRFH